MEKLSEASFLGNGASHAGGAGGADGGGRVGAGGKLPAHVQELNEEVRIRLDMHRML